VIIIGIYKQTKEHVSKNNQNSILENGITKKVTPMVYYVLLDGGVSYKSPSEED